MSPHITLTEQVEVFVDPYGYSVNWIHAIHNAAHELFRGGETIDRWNASRKTLKGGNFHLVQ